MAEPSFEELVAQLEERAKKLEAGNIPLEESIGIYEEGAALVDKLRALLDSAELRIERLQGRIGDDRAQDDGYVSEADAAD